MNSKCNMTNYPKDVEGRQCCPSKPKSFNRESADACKKECAPAAPAAPAANPSENADRTKMMCCMSTCIMKQSGALAADGTIDAQATITKLKNSTTAPAVWGPIIEAVVKKCIADGKNFSFKL